MRWLLIQNLDTDIRRTFFPVSPNHAEILCEKLCWITSKFNWTFLKFSVVFQSDSASWFIHWYNMLLIKHCIRVSWWSWLACFYRFFKGWLLRDQEAPVWVQTLIRYRNVLPPDSTWFLFLNLQLLFFFSAIFNDCQNDCFKCYESRSLMRFTDVNCRATLEIIISLLYLKSECVYF